MSEMRSRRSIISKFTKAAIGAALGVELFGGRNAEASSCMYCGNWNCNSNCGSMDIIVSWGPWPCCGSDGATYYTYGYCCGGYDDPPWPEAHLSEVDSTVGTNGYGCQTFDCGCRNVFMGYYC